MATRRKQKITATAVQEVPASIPIELNEVVLTLEGERQVRAELEHLRIVRQENLERVRAAHGYGDSMENAELEEAKTEQAAIEGRILELHRLLTNARVIDGSAASDGCVHVGTTVRVKDVARGDELDFHIVGAMQADPTQSRISNQSPMGQALIGRRPGDIVSVATPAGSSRYEIVSVQPTN